MDGYTACWNAASFAELEKLLLYVGEKKRITLGDVETMVLAAKQRSLYELTDAVSAKDRVRALQMLDAILSSGDGEEAARVGESVLRCCLLGAAHCCVTPPTSPARPRGPRVQRAARGTGTRSVCPR